MRGTPVQELAAVAALDGLFLLSNRDPQALARGFRFWAWLHVIVLIVAVVAVLVLLRLADAPRH